MPMRVTFSTNYASTIEYYKRISKASGQSLSSLLSDELHRASLSHAAKRIPIIKDKPTQKKTDIEFYEEVWKKEILIPQYILDAMEFKSNVQNNEMSKLERAKIKDKLEDLINTRDIHNAIYIYTDRKVNNARRLAAGIGTILLLKKIAHDDILFDINKIILIPVIKLISYRMDTVLEDYGVNINFPHICWIPIYYINNKAVMIPVIRKRDVSLMTKLEGGIVIINPFDD